MRRVLSLAAVLVAAVAVPGVASAQEVASEEGAAGEEAVSAQVVAAEPAEPLELLTARRAQPSYDGRAPAPPTFGQNLLWIPRIIMFPLYVTWEYLVRVPAGAAVSAIEKAEVGDLLFDFFTWEDRGAGIVPTFFFDFGFLPSAGAYLFWNDVFAEGNDIRVWGGFWGIQYIHATVIDRYAIRPDESELEFKLDFLRRPDQIYSGEGYDIRVGSRENGAFSGGERSRYAVDLFAAHATYRHKFWRESQIVLEAGVNSYRFGDTDWGDDEPSTVEAALLPGYNYGLPNSFAEGYTKVYQSMYLAIDGRRARPASATGLRLQAYGELGFDAEDLVGKRWFRYGGTGGAWVDVGHGRSLGVSVGALFADPIGEGGLPFEELIRLDDFPNLITGYYAGDIRGRSGAGVSLVYRYPIWVWLEGVVNVSTANAFGAHLSDFEFERLRLTWGIGISTIAERDTSFTAEVAWGTDTFEQGAGISSFRFAIGATEL